MEHNYFPAIHIFPKTTIHPSIRLFFHAARLLEGNTIARIDDLQRVNETVDEERRLRVIVDQVLETDDALRGDAHEHLRRQGQWPSAAQQKLSVVLPALLLSAVEFQQQRGDVVQIAVISSGYTQRSQRTQQRSRRMICTSHPRDGRQSPLPWLLSWPQYPRAHSAGPME